MEILKLFICKLLKNPSFIISFDEKNKAICDYGTAPIIFLSDCNLIAKKFDIKNGFVYYIKSEQKLIFSKSLNESNKQRIRNAWFVR